MKSKSVVMLAVAAVLSIGLFAGCARSIEARSEHLMQRFTADLDLNTNQQAIVNDMRLGVIQKLRAQEPAALQLKNDMIAFIKSDTVDPAKLKQIQDKMQALHFEIRDYATGKMLELQKTLTPAQKAKIAEKIEWMSQKMQETLDEK